MPLTMRRGDDNTTLLTSIDVSLNSIDTSLNEIEKQNAYNNTNIRMGLVPNAFHHVIQSIRHNVSNAITLPQPDLATEYIHNTGSLPLNSLDQSVPAAAVKIGFTSSSANDTLAGSGAQVILVTGLDTDWNPLVEQVFMAGQLQTTATTGLFLRINEIQVVAAGSIGWNEGVISCFTDGETLTAGGLPTTEVLNTEEEQRVISKSGIYSVRAGYSFITTHYKVTTDATESKQLALLNVVHPVGLGVPRVVGADLTVNGTANFPLDAFPKVPEKSDVIIKSAKAGASAVNRATVFWGGFLILDTAFPNAL